TGAKTVNGPGPESVSTRPAACTAATSVVWSAEFTAFSTIFLSASMAAPPTIGLSWAKAAPENEATEMNAARERARRERVILEAFLLISSHPFRWDKGRYGRRRRRVSA